MIGKVNEFYQHLPSYTIIIHAYGAIIFFIDRKIDLWINIWYSIDLPILY